MLSSLSMNDYGLAHINTNTNSNNNSSSSKKEIDMRTIEEIKMRRLNQLR